MEPTPASSKGLPPVVGAFGKLPKAGDFVRAGLANETTRAFEEWLHQGVQYAHDKKGAAWKQPFLAGSAYGFVYRSDRAEGAKSIAGVIAPSQDSVGRAFPLALYAQAPTAVANALLPYALGTFLDSLVPVISDTRELTAADLAQRIPTHAAVEDTTKLQREYELWARATRVAEVWQSIYEGSDLVQPAYALYTLLEIARPFRGGSPPANAIGVRFPLGRLGVTAASFWLDVMRCAFRWNQPELSFFWFFDGRSGDLLIQPGRTRPSTLIELWLPDSRNDALSDLLRLTPWDGARAMLPTRVLDTLQRSDASVVDLLNALWF